MDGNGGSGLRGNQHTDPTGTTTSFLYDGTDLVAEYDNAGNLLRRYVHGPGVDEPLVAYTGSGTTNKEWLYADHLGSVVASANASGASAAIYRYGPFGEPNESGGARFRYTGQMYLHNLSLYHYKARVYSPTIGRFLQTDPIDTVDDLNLYSYVGNSPPNSNDPSGLCPNCVGFVIGGGIEFGRQLWVGDWKSGSFAGNLLKIGVAGLAGAAGVGVGRQVAALTASVGYRAVGNSVFGSVSGAVGQFANNLIDGKSPGDGVVRAAVLGGVGGGLGSYVGDKVDALASAARAAIRVSIGNIGGSNIAQGIRDTTRSSKATSMSAAAPISLGERGGALLGGLPSSGDSVFQSYLSPK